MKCLSVVRILLLITLLLVPFKNATAATCCKTFVSDIICSVNKSAELILMKLNNTESILDLALENFPEIFSQLDHLNALQQNILINLISILDLAELDGTKLDHLHNTTDTILDKACTVLSLNDTIENTTNKTESFAEIIELQTQTILDKTTIMQSLLDSSLVQINILNSQVDLLANPCAPTPIYGPTTISTPGYYCVANDITATINLAPIITISTNNVVLDLNGHTIENLGTGFGTACIETSGNNNITIRNGTLRTNRTGINVLGGNTIHLENLASTKSGRVFFDLTNVIEGTITNCSTGANCFNAIILTSCNNIVVKDCLLNGTRSNVLNPGSNAITLTSCNNCTIKNTTASTWGSAGFYLDTSTNCLLNNCSGLYVGNQLSGSAYLYGFYARNGTGNIFEACVANNITALDPTIPIAGFALDGTENCSKIIGCESSNISAPFTTSVVNTATVVTGAPAYGILLKSTFTALAAPSNSPSYGSIIYSVNWSPDNNYLAVGGAGGTIQLYQFSTPNSTPTLINNSVNYGTNIFTMDWSPDGKYLAVYGNSGNLSIYLFNSNNNSLTLLSSIFYGTQFNSASNLKWSPNSQYIALGGNAGTLSIYKFNQTTQLLSLVSSIASGTIFSIDWSANGDNLAVASSLNTGTLIVYGFNNQTLTLVAQNIVGIRLQSVSWSSVDNYIATGNNITGTIYLYYFNQSNNQLTLIDSSASYPFAIESLQWSPDNNYLAVTGDVGQIAIYIFDRASQQLQLYDNSQNYGNVALSLNWSPSGQSLTVGGFGGAIKNYAAIQFPSNNIIKDNIVYCSNAGSSLQPNGFGISGSNVANLIINNTCYCNNGSNYQFVTSPAIFNPLFDLTPTKLQNLSIGCSEAIAAPFNVQEQINFISEQLGKIDIINNQARDIKSQLDTINFSLLDATVTSLLSKTDIILNNLPLCNPITITPPVTISTAGSYCLSASSTGNITINSSNVTLNLSEHVLTATVGDAITITSNKNRITIANGKVIATNGNGITINSGSEQIIVRSVIAENSVIGMRLVNTSNALIDACEFVSNTTGLDITSTSSAIIVTNSTAFNNTNAGFSLNSSTKNYFNTCKALRNGTASTSNGYGFVSNNGSANIFEHCLAENNLTNTTSWTSASAGFALLGSESCSRIIECTSNNNIVPTQTILVDHTFTATNGSGTFVTTHTLVASGVPYGILLGSTLQVTGTAPSLVQSFALDPGSTATTDSVNAVSWTPDNTLVAIGGTFQAGVPEIKVYAFDPSISNTLTLMGSANPGTSNANDRTLTVDWSPNGKYLAVGGQVVNNRNDLLVYYYDTCMTVSPLVLLTSVDTATGNNNDIVYSVRWSPNGQYLAAGGSFEGSVSNIDLKVYAFNAISTQPLTELTITLSDLATTSTVYSIDWSPDGNYIAIGGALDGTNPTDNVRVYSFNAAASPIMSAVASVDPGTGSSLESIKSVRWSPDGKYLAAGGNVVPISIVTTTTTLASQNLTVYAFQPTTSPALLKIAGAYVGGTGNVNDTINSLSWSANEQYIAVGGSFPDAGVNDLRIFTFNPQLNNPLSQAATNDPGVGDTNDSVNSVAWSPDGGYLLVGCTCLATPTTSGQDLRIFNTLSFPQRNSIQNNTVFCNMSNASTMQTGVGISGSSIANLIINNWAYNNIFNYQFVVNTFSQLFEAVPSPLENVGIAAFEAIVNPDNIGLNIIGIENQTIDMTSKLAAVLTKL